MSDAPDLSARVAAIEARLSGLGVELAENVPTGGDHAAVLDRLSRHEVPTDGRDPL